MQNELEEELDKYWYFTPANIGIILLIFSAITLVTRILGEITLIAFITPIALITVSLLLILGNKRPEINFSTFLILAATLSILETNYTIYLTGNSNYLWFTVFHLLVLVILAKNNYSYLIMNAILTGNSVLWLIKYPFDITTQQILAAHLIIAPAGYLVNKIKTKREYNFKQTLNKLKREQEKLIDTQKEAGIATAIINTATGLIQEKVNIEELLEAPPISTIQELSYYTNIEIEQLLNQKDPITNEYPTKNKKHLTINIRKQTKHQYKVIIRDITKERKQKQQEQILHNQQQKISELNYQKKLRKRLLNGISHELNTPMTPIILNMHMLQQMIEKNPQGSKKQLDTLSRNIGQLQLRIKELLEMTRIESEQFKLLPQDITIKQLQTPLHDEITQYLDIIEDQSKPEQIFKGDIERLKLAIALMAEFTQKNNQTDNKPTLQIKQTKSHLQYIYNLKNDNPKTLENLIQPFSTLAKNTEETITSIGVSIYIVKIIIETHGGTIRLENTEENRIILEIPLHGEGFES